MKLNVLLAKKQHAKAIFIKMLSDYIGFFKTKQSPFKGVRKTYVPRGDNPLDPNYISNERVVTTVAEKLDYFEKGAASYVNQFLSVEATNATAAKAELVVDGKSYGKLSTMELLALKSFLETKELVSMYEELPTRTELLNWKRTDDPEYNKREIWTTDKVTGIHKTSEVTPYILEDPNVQHLKDTSKYVPMTAQKRVDIILGEYDITHFSGEIAHADRAGVLRRRSMWYEAVLEALEKANVVEAIPSELDAQKMFDNIHRGN